MLYNQMHRKTASNAKSSEKSNTTKTIKPNNLMTNLACLQVLKKLVSGPSKSHNHNNSKTRIRTEGNEKQFIKQMSVSPKKNNNEQSTSPPQRNSNSQIDVIANLINSNINQTEYKRLSREQRNQSADFQALLTQQQQKLDNRNWKSSGKKKFNSYGNLNDQVYFSQRGGLSECPSALQLIQNNLESKLLKGSSSMKSFPSPPILIHQQITTQEFKEKLSNLSRDFKKKQIEEELQKTQKKQPTKCLLDHDESDKQLKNASQRSRSVDSSSSRFENIKKEDCHRTEGDFIVNATSYIVQRKLESKIDQLVFQVQILKKKSEQLELQNKLLFENLSKFQKDSDCNTDVQNQQPIQERNVLMNKLDQMIGMQKRQEENLNFFKQFFAKNYDQSRRIKTEQQQQQQEEEVKMNQKTEILSKQRPFVKSAYQGLDFNI